MTSEQLMQAFDTFMFEKNAGISDGSAKRDTDHNIQKTRALLDRETDRVLSVALVSAFSKGYGADDGIRAAMGTMGFSMFEFGRYIAKLEADEEAFNRVSAAKG